LLTLVTGITATCMLTLERQRALHWLDQAEPPLHSMKLPSMPAGLVLTDAGPLLACLDDGLHVVDPDAGSSEMLAAYPKGMHGRANDANADGSGNLVTGTLNLVPGPGGSWWFSGVEGWRLLDDDVGNTNGPLVLDIDGGPTLVLADTLARLVYAYSYNGREGTIGTRHVLATTLRSRAHPMAPRPTPTAGCGAACSAPARSPASPSAGLDRVVDVPMANPSDVTFGGSDLDRLFVTSIALDLGGGDPAAEAGWVLGMDGLGVTGRPESRFHLE
jgi:L-arabinonolactonase